MPVSAANRSTRRRVRAGCVWLMAAVLLSGLPPGAVEREPVPRQEPAVSMSEQVYRRLEHVHELMRDDRLEDADERLDALAAMRLNDHERALVHQTRAHLHLQRDNTREAIEHFRVSTELDALPNAAQQETLYALAGLYASEGEHARTIATLDAWFRHETAPAAEAYLLMGSSHVQRNNHEAALLWLREAVTRAPEPRESWHQLLLAVYVELGLHEQAADLLRTTVALWPDRARYWDALSSLYLQLERDEDALATLMLAYRRGLVTDEGRLLHLARLNIYLGVPYAAGEILTDAFADGRVERNRRNLELLLSAWTSAREFERAVAVVDELSVLTGEAGYLQQKARLLAERADWAGVLEASSRALAADGLSDREAGQTQILLGMAAAELGDHDRAGRAFRAARRHGGELRRNADAWLAWLGERRGVREPAGD